MEYRRLGKSGLQVSVLSLGSWLSIGDNMSNDDSYNLVKLAYESGVNFFDTAESYADGNAEIVLGNIFNKLDLDRSEYIISTKVFWGGKKPNQIGLSRKRIFEACNNSLKRLGLDYIDLYSCHRPDKNTTIEETVRAMSDLITQGKIMYWGTSEWSAKEIMEAYGVARQYNLVPPITEQPKYNMLHRNRVEVEYLSLYEGIGMGTAIWSPLASGLLSGKYNDIMPSDSRLNLPGMEWLKKKLINEDSKINIEKIKKLIQLANSLNTDIANLALAWCLKNKNVSTVILGVSKIEQLKNNLLSIDLTSKIDDNIMNEIEIILDNKPEQPEF